jgi:antitoxin YefM
MTTMTAAEFQSSFKSSLARVIEHQKRLRVTTSKGNVVIVSEKDYDRLIESLYLSSQPGLVQRIADGNNESTAQMPPYDPKASW